MNFADPFLILAIVFALAAAACALWAISAQRRAAKAEAQAWMLNEKVAQGEERLRLLEDQSATQIELIKAQAAQSANAIAEQLIKRADENAKSRERLAEARLEAQLKPVAETLAKFEAQVTAVEKARAEETGGLKAQISALLEASTATQAEARKLSAALRRGAGVQGRWGEQMLRNVLEMAGLKHGIDFTEQVQLDSGRLRPDVVVRMPRNAAFVIDAKCSLTAYLEAQDAGDDLAREAAYVRHTASLRGHVQQLSAKAYWDALEVSPDFVTMFVPGDGILAAALERAPELMTEAMEKRVIIATPSTLFALCKAVAYGWRAEDQAKNAVEVAALGRELYKRIADMGGHVAGVGRSLSAAVDKYNAFVGSLESRVLPKAREFEKLKVDHGGKPMDELDAIETAVRPVTKLEVEQSPTLTLGNDAPT
ncbi:DNA recombination protein RmuC [uncultured Caulobacter sp.]|uniref:DNA recombination protein RmuC n=1 Tax=uncultured Caulobacter sp. TaxID=158749 RepID=UPI0026316275|nr:DNA recombination protein RmuC [uncultured Caulobacter sp.]